MNSINIKDPRIIRFRDEAFPLIKEKFHPNQVLIFGSRAGNNQTDDSDLDVIIVSGQFRSVPFIKRYGLLFSLIKIPIHIDYICYTPEEWENIKEQSVIIDDALSGPIIALA